MCTQEIIFEMQAQRPNSTHFMYSLLKSHSTNFNVNLFKSSVLEISNCDIKLINRYFLLSVTSVRATARTRKNICINNLDKNNIKMEEQSSSLHARYLPVYS